MPTIPIIKTGNLSSTYCFTSWDNLLQEYANRLAANATVSEWNIGIDTPSAANRDKPWLRFNANGSLDLAYVWWNGMWISPHPIPPSSQERKIWTGTVGGGSQLETYDGGAAGAVADVGGPMWEEDTDMQAKFLVGVGSFASGATVAVNGTGGNETHTLTRAELPNVDLTVSNVERMFGIKSSGNTFDFDGSSGTAHSTTIVPTIPLGDGDAHDNLPPYYGVYFIKRTARIFKTV